ncbi:MAG TPA: Tex-like N-terminal domain-containing protein, partial [Candidatus Binatia bacterium]|nr:Tex-like N-terminal domain-containing protein [Candidatus Binatia bacterium]
MDHSKQIARDLRLGAGQIAATIDLLDEGNTLPFIARYRKEATGSLDEAQLRAVEERLTSLRALDERRAVVLNSIATQDKLTPDLQAQIQAVQTLTELEDLYQPFKPKRRTRASVAREKGLEPLAALILEQIQTRKPLEELVQPFLGEGTPTVDEALSGARDIVAETISDNAEIRGQTREKA